eukprot:COSAG04_NODE_1432_length_6795_cov_3.370221_4_plen_1114_part_00
MHECGYCEDHCTCRQSARRRSREQLPPGLAPTQLPHRPAAAEAGRRVSQQLGEAAEAEMDQMMTYATTGDGDDKREPLPLGSPQAELSDWAHHVGLEGAAARSFVKNGGAGGANRHEACTEPQQGRRYNTLDTVTKMLARIIDRRTPDTLISDWHAHRHRQVSKEDEQSCVDNCLDLLNKVGSYSEAGIVLSAVLSKSVEHGYLRRKTERNLIRRTAECEENYDQIAAGDGVPEYQPTTRTRVKPEIVKRLVRWILSAENVQLLSWTKKKAPTDAGFKQIPCVSRRKNKSAMWRAYKAAYPKDDRVQQSAFMNVVKHITGKESKSVKAVDYMVSDLLHQNRQRLERLVRLTLKDQPEEAKAIISEMRKIFTFVKSSYSGRIRSSECPSHCVEWALNTGNATRASDAVTDEETLAIFQWFDLRLKPAVDKKHHNLIDESVEKLTVFMGHAVRANVQQTAVKEAYDALKSDPSKCIILGDYKQKLLPSQHRESSVEHYGKRGISYHSFLCAYMEGDEMKLRYFDTVVEGDATQDIGMTLSICEEALFRMRAVVPSSVTSFTFQSDNARTYQNLCLPLLLPELAESAKWLCARLLHTETQDGKCVVDAHFQHVNKQIDKFIAQEGDEEEEGAHKACTADQICTAMADDEGLGSTDVAVLRLDREKLAQIEADTKVLHRTTSELFPSMVMDVKYSQDPDTADEVYASSGGAAHAVEGDEQRPRLHRTKLAGELQSTVLKLSMSGVEKLHSSVTGSYEVGSIEDKREADDPEEGGMEYLCRWKGWGREDEQWIPQAVLRKTAPVLLAEYLDEPVEAEGEGAGAAEPDQRRLKPAYLPASCDGVLPATGAQVLRHAPAVKEQVKRKRKAELLADAVEEESSSDEEDDAPLSMTVLSQAVREFLVAVQEPEVGVTTPDKMSIKGLVPGRRAGRASPPLKKILKRGWADRPAHGKTKGATYLSGKYMDLVQELFEAGEKKKGCKSSPHQMHAEMERRFPEDFDLPSVVEISGGVSRLVQRGKKAKSAEGGGSAAGQGRRTTEASFPAVFEPLRDQFEAVLLGGAGTWPPAEAVAWLEAVKPGQEGGEWPEGLDWPAKMKTHVTKALGRWQKEKQQPAAAAQ